MSDRLNDTLTSLRTDVDRVPLADSAAVRRRGNQRTRRQAVGSSLAVVALVAGAVGIGGALVGGDDNAAPLPAEQPTVSTTNEPAPEPTAVELGPLTPALLLGPEDLPPVPNQEFTVGETLEAATESDAEERGLILCGVSPSGAQVPETALVRTFPSDLDAYAWEWVAQYADEGQARQAFTALTNSCEAQAETTSELLSTDTVRSSTFSAEPDSEFFGELSGVALRGDTVVVVSLRGMLREGDVDVTAFDDAFGLAVDRVATR